MRSLVLLFSLLATACASQLPDHIDLQPQAENVEFAYEPPSPDAYKMIGAVTGEAAANDPDVAQEAAKNDIRNKAAAMGASLVTIDQNLGEPVPLQDKTKVKLVGRAYKAVD